MSIDRNELAALKTSLAYSHANFSFLLQSVAMLEKITKLLSKTVKKSTTFKVS
jgi:hypothetical protein